MNKRIFILISLLAFLFEGFSQIGGHNVYSFLNYSYSSRAAALGGGLISVHDNDPTLIMQNPSYISPDHHNSLMLNGVDYFSNTGYGAALYSRTFNKVGSFAAEMRFIGYGNFVGADELGNETGNFFAGDYALTVGWGRQLGKNFSIGTNLKAIYCGYESYSSFGLAVDVAGSYYNPEKRISLSLLFKNIGSELKPFTPGNYEPLPFDIQLAFSQKFAHLPVRYHISLHSLYRWNMATLQSSDAFLDTDIDTGEPKYPSKTAQFFDNFFRHIIFGLEIEPIKYFSIQLSYNHNRHQEMKIPQKSSMAGFSYGFMINIHAISIGFSRSHYAVGAVPNYITFSTNFDELAKLSKENKKKKLEKIQ